MSAATIEHEIQTLIEPLVADFGAEVFDVTWGGGRLKVAVDAPGGIDTTTLSKVSRTISQELDLRDPIESRYTLEVSSPGLERRLRRPEHFAKSIGSTVTLKLKDGKTRLSGEIVEATDTEVTLRLADGDLGGAGLAGANNNSDEAGGDLAEAGDPSAKTISYSDIARAQTVFQWEGAPREGAQGAQHNKPGANGKAISSKEQGTTGERANKQGASA